MTLSLHSSRIPLSPTTESECTEKYRRNVHQQLSFGLVSTDRSDQPYFTGSQQSWNGVRRLPVQSNAPPAFQSRGRLRPLAQLCRLWNGRINETAGNACSFLVRYSALINPAGGYCTTGCSMHMAHGAWRMEHRMTLPLIFIFVAFP